MMIKEEDTANNLRKRILRKSWRKKREGERNENIVAMHGILKKTLKKLLKNSKKPNRNLNLKK